MDTINTEPLTEEERLLQPVVYRRTRRDILRKRAAMGYPDAIDALWREFNESVDPRQVPPSANVQAGPI